MLPLIRRGLWRDCEDGVYLAAVSGCSPQHLERELSRHRPLDKQPVYAPEVVAIIRAWLQSPAGQARPVNPWYAWDHLVGHAERQAALKAALGHAALLAADDDPLVWDHLSTEEQDELVTAALAWLVVHDHPEVVTDPATSQRDLDGWWSDTVEEAYKAWLHEEVSYSTADMCRPDPPAVYAISREWAARIQTVAEDAALPDDDPEGTPW